MAGDKWNAAASLSIWADCGTILLLSYFRIETGCIPVRSASSAELIWYSFLTYFIFSDDAAALEHKIHEILNNCRVNKVNLRKEFFHISLDELESLVSNLAPTAEFKRTMLAEQYRQSLSIDKIVEASIDSEDDDE